MALNQMLLLTYLLP